MPDPTPQPEPQNTRAWDRAALVVILIGAVLRVARYCDNRSLWLDEILLARNILSRSAWNLLTPLDFRQGAPPLFLLSVKAATTLFGPSERALRLIPLLAGLAALPLLYAVARRLLGPKPAVVAVAILAIIEPAIYYSSEAKQYSTDLLTTLVLWHAFLRYRERPTKLRAAALFATGVGAMYFSHPAIFVLAGGVAAMLLSRRDLRRPLVLLSVGWLLTFIPNYLLFLRPLSHDGGLRDYWANAFMPWSTSALPWTVTALWGLFADYATMWITGRLWPSAYAVAALCTAILGVGAIARRSGNAALLVTGPLVMAFGAAAVHAYPFSGRLLLFLVPVPIIAMAATFLPARPNDRVDTAVFAIARLAVLLAVLLPTAGRAAVFLVRPPRREEIRPVLAELAKQVKPGDVLYVYHGASAGFEYYGKGFDWTGVEIIEGHNRDEDVAAFERDVPALVGRGKAWVLFSHTPAGTARDERFVALLPEGTRVVQEDEARGAGAYLYEFPHVAK